jgi:glycosyltransferase involved in cell wall biosynthesis
VKISVLVPAYNEERAMERTLTVLSRYLTSTFDDFEIIVVSDGSHDQTFKIAQNFASDRVRVFEYQPNRGKGHALKYAFSQSTGEVVVFYDTGIDFPPSQIGDFWEILQKTGADLVVGSKRHSQSKVNYPLKRQIISMLAQLCTRLLFNLNVRDTQVGLKIFKRRVLEEVMPLMLVKRYAFDIELLAIARHRGFKIVEAPVELDLNFSSAGTFAAVRQTLLDTLGIFYRLKVMKFYDRSEAERERILKERRNTLIDRVFSPLYGDRE